MNNAPQLHIGPSSEVVDALYKGLRELLIVMGDVHSCEEVQLAVLKTMRKGLTVQDIKFDHCHFDLSVGKKTNPEWLKSEPVRVTFPQPASSDRSDCSTPTPPPPAHGHGNY